MPPALQQKVEREFYDKRREGRGDAVEEILIRNAVIFIRQHALIGGEPLLIPRPLAKHLVRQTDGFVIRDRVRARVDVGVGLALSASALPDLEDGGAQFRKNFGRRGAGEFFDRLFGPVVPSQNILIERDAVFLGPYPSTEHAIVRHDLMRHRRAGPRTKNRRILLPFRPPRLYYTDVWSMN